MEIPIQKDGDRQPYVEWNQGCGGYNRTWIRRPTDGSGQGLGGRRALPQRGSRGGTLQAPNPALQPSANPLRALSAAELGR